MTPGVTNCESAYRPANLATSLPANLLKAASNGKHHLHDSDHRRPRIRRSPLRPGIENAPARNLAERYVKFRSGMAYEFVQLLSAARIKAEILVPGVPEVKIGHLAPFKKSPARFCNRLVRWKILNPLFQQIGPFFRIVGWKEATAS